MSKLFVLKAHNGNKVLINPDNITNISEDGNHQGYIIIHTVDGSSDTFQYDFTALIGFLGASDLSVKPGNPGYK
jgi:hypothetical protein